MTTTTARREARAFRAYMEDGAIDVERILSYAALAPSGHNTQPWVVRVVSPERWIIAIDPARRLPAVDPTDHDTLLSIGAFTETLVLAAGALGWSADVETLDGPGDDVAAVTLRATPATGFDLEEIRLRRTLRRGYLPRPLAPADTAALLRSLDGRGGFFAMTSREGSWLSAATVEAFRAQTYRDEAQRELAQWIRFGGEVRVRGDGITAATMELPAIARFGMNRFMAPGDVVKPGFRARGIDSAAKQAFEGAGWLVLENDGDTRDALLTAGRRFQRLALGLRGRMLAAHPMSQVLQESPWREQVAAMLGTARPPQLLLRVGYVRRYPVPVSPRRSVSSFVRAA